MPIPKVAELAWRLQQMVKCRHVTGEDCSVMKLYLPSLEKLDKVLDQSPAYGEVTSVVQGTPVPPWDLPPPGDGAHGSIV